MINIIIILVVLVIGFFAVKGCISHFNHEGGCCGGGNNTCKKVKKPFMSSNSAEFTVSGMKCKNCAKKIESEIAQKFSLWAKINYKSGKGIIKSNATINIEEIKNLVESLGYGFN